jgi:hypothetical protein
MDMPLSAAKCSSAGPTPGGGVCACALFAAETRKRKIHFFMMRSFESIHQLGELRDLLDADRTT